MDLKKELEDAEKRREVLRDQFNQNEGVISFIKYHMEKEKKETPDGNAQPNN